MQNSFRLYSLGLVTVLSSVGLTYFWTCDPVPSFKYSPQLCDNDMSKNLSAFVLGGTGGAGSAIVKALAREPRFTKVLLVSRRQTEFPESDDISNYGKFEQKILPDFDKILDGESAEIFKGLNVGFYALGVSVTRVDEATYRKIEHGYSTAVGRYAKKGGCQHFHWVSGSNVKKDSWFLFGKVKSQVEEELGQMGFPRLSIYRPAGILTDDNSGGMAGSGVVKTLRFIDRCNKISVEAEMLGNVIVANTFRDSDQLVETLPNSEIVEMGRELSGIKKCK